MRLIHFGSLKCSIVNISGSLRKTSSVIPKDLKQLRGRKNVKRMCRGIKFIANRVSNHYKIRIIIKTRGKREEKEVNVSFKFCSETGFKQVFIPFGIRYFGSCTWLIISTALKISLKQTYFAHTHPPLKICLLSPFPEPDGMS